MLEQNETVTQEVESNDDTSCPPDKPFIILSLAVRRKASIMDTKEFLYTSPKKVTNRISSIPGVISDTRNSPRSLKNNFILRVVKERKVDII